MIKESARSHLKCNFDPEMVWGETFNLKCFKKCWKNIRFYDIQNGLQVYMKILTQAGFFLNNFIVCLLKGNTKSVLGFFKTCF